MAYACFAVLSGVASTAHAQSGQAPDVLAPVIQSSEMTHEARLEQGVRYFQLGERDEARRILAALVVTPGLPAPLRQESRVYLAELLLVEEDVDRARDFLEQVLTEDPNYTIDLFRHTPEVAGEFDYVRALRLPVAPIEPTAAAPQPVLVTMPMSVWNPFARYHFVHDRPVRGLVYLTGFTTTAVASGFLWGLVHADRRYRVGLGDRQTLDELDLRSLRRLQWGATGLVYGFWATSVIDARTHWRKVGMNASLSPSVSRLDGGSVAGAVRVQGTF
ncbi:MAG: hypothetical protein CL927_13010 [Deltaproteobacteria bacterium]|nr:hypothetical protein [Deltaproteobacteria bacterium]HCH66667.1 hypothetical protein [Deltaproteobacteria bacterium]